MKEIEEKLLNLGATKDGIVLLDKLSNPKSFKFFDLCRENPTNKNTKSILPHAVVVIYILFLMKIFQQYPPPPPHFTTISMSMHKS